MLCCKCVDDDVCVTRFASPCTVSSVVLGPREWPMARRAVALGFLSCGGLYLKIFKYMCVHVPPRVVRCTCVKRCSFKTLLLRLLTRFALLVSRPNVPCALPDLVPNARVPGKVVRAPGSPAGGGDRQKRLLVCTGIILNSIY